MKIVAAIVLFVLSAASVFYGVKLAIDSKTHLDAGVEKAGHRKWASLILIVIGFFLLSGGILLISNFSLPMKLTVDA